jgi:hypothetical protein
MVWGSVVLLHTIFSMWSFGSTARDRGDGHMADDRRLRLSFPLG